MIETKLKGIETAANYKGGPLPHSEWRVVDKALADEWLLKNTKNRKFRRMQAEKFSRDINAGDREITHQGIGFDLNGVLVDGQHTLTAISLTGKSLYLLVTYNLPERARVVVDGGATRSTHDAAIFAGLDGSRSDVAVARFLCPNRRATKMEVIHSFEKYKERIDLVNSFFPDDNRRYVGISPVVGTLVRASFHVEPARLRRFCEILVTSSPDSNKPGELAVLKLRDYLVRGRNMGTEKYFDEARDRTRFALRHFIENRPMSQLRKEEAEIFPLPGEEVQ